jgi:hypothetical protein
MIEYTPVESSMIKKIGYNASNHQLHIIFHNDSHYIYYNVPVSIYIRLGKADSVGKYFLSEVKPIFVCQNVTGSAETE